MPLMRLLSSDSLRIQEQALWALVNISQWQANKMRMIESGLLDKLVRTPGGWGRLGWGRYRGVRLKLGVGGEAIQWGKGRGSKANQMRMIESGLLDKLVRTHGAVNRGERGTGGLRAC
jgi:hypothetical protein